MVDQYEINLPPFPRGFHLITETILQQIRDLPKAGIFHVFIKHTSAGICINENADPSVLVDFESVFNKIVPEHMPFLTHTMEGPDDMPAHIKSVFIGSSVSIPISNNKLNLGVWQGIYLGEFRNSGGSRRLVVTIHH